ncbi:aromatic amino acid aminotransferase [Histoplasma capsulatum]|uniref:Aromatic amino acid aminotransferase n=1 Tax=Ajellomyces capsulatus TaxID=5037 RepID=A0A8A1LVL6_AJECA|nr:aromatic amino acid aminotransferase [Histoplasma capsulatum]
MLLVVGSPELGRWKDGFGGWRGCGMATNGACGRCARFWRRGGRLLNKPPRLVLPEATAATMIVIAMKMTKTTGSSCTKPHCTPSSSRAVACLSGTWGDV